MALLDNTLAHLAPGVVNCRDVDAVYNPRRGLAIYCLPIPGYSPSAPGVVLGEALASRTGLGCTLLEGIPAKIPEGAVVVAQYNALKAVRPDLLQDVPEMKEQGQYAIRLARHALITSPSREGLAAAMQTLAMTILRHSDDLLPGSLITDAPNCQVRALAVELERDEVGIGLLMQIASFAATFKANRLHIIIRDGFDTNRDLPGLDTFVQTCQSYGITIGVRLPLLGKILSKEMTLIEAWSAVRAAARHFGASQAALDDPCPPSADKEACRLVVESVVKGEVGLQNVSLDARCIARSGFSGRELKASGVTGWYRMWDRTTPPPTEMDGIPLVFGVQSPVPGFSSRTSRGFQKRLAAALKHLDRQPRKEIMISFRDIGVSHMWQNLLYPSATGLITAWGQPALPEEAAWRFSNLLYGDSASAVMGMWDSIAAAFPPGLSPAEEMLVRQTAFGRWPETDEEFQFLARIDWLAVTRNIRSAADAMKAAVTDLSRNAATLVGARLALYALSWLHCFVALTPELERRRRDKWDEDARTEPIANELYSNFTAWHSHLQELYAESGLELSELDRVDAMGLRLKGLCEGIFE
ncbi:MAG: hypothetical protein LIQ31_12090 [Planctomycetes bacterium]|nr:hypothetical protein [Planctomycetota bacterium]